MEKQNKYFKKIKRYLADPLIWATFMSMSPLITHSAITFYRGYSSGFFSAYNGAIERANPKNRLEELNAQVKVFNRVINLSDEGKNLQQIVEALNSLD